MRLLLAALLVATSGVPAPASDADNPKKPKVRLAVLVVFDQMRGDYLAKWQPLFGDGGFKRLQADGAWFPDCHYPYANTSTGPGHASMLAGCSGDKHGIINNNWYDRAAAEDAYCVGSTRYELVPPIPPGSDPDNLNPRTKKKPVGVGSPDRMLGPTLADVLKAGTNGAGKVVGLSLKDRSAVLLSGRKPDGVYWFEGRFGTSTYYRDTLPAWVTAFNKGGLAESYHGKDWVKFKPDLDYNQHAGPDDAPGEGKGKGQGVAFPHPTTGGQDKAGKNLPVGKAYYEAMVNSPYGNDLLLAFAKAAIEAEKLGQDDVPDLLTISFSSNDLVGHAWGPDSHEVLDITLRSDALMADLLAFLDAKVGAGKYAMVVTADHGICPLPESITPTGPAGKRYPTLALLTNAERHLREAFGAPDTPALVTPAPKPDAKPTDPPAPKRERTLWIEEASLPNIYLNYAQIKAANQTPDAVAAKLSGWLRTQPGIARAYTRADLLGNALPPTDPYLAPSRKSYHPDRGGDVVVVTAPFALLGSYPSGTTHGSPHPYDTSAAFLAFGPGVGGGKRTEKVTPLHAAAILADMLGVNPPRNAEYGLPTTLKAADPVPSP